MIMIMTIEVGFDACLEHFPRDSSYVLKAVTISGKTTCCSERRHEAFSQTTISTESRKCKNKASCGNEKTRAS